MQFLDQDSELGPWIFGILHGEPLPAGDFLWALAQAAQMADPENYAILRPALLAIMAKYPKYRCPDFTEPVVAPAPEPGTNP